MKILYLITIMLAVPIMFSQCKKDEENQCIVGNEDYNLEYRDVGAFNVVELYGPFKTFIAQLNNTETKLFGETNILSSITTHVSNEVLTVAADTEYCYEIHHEIECYLTSPIINRFIVDAGQLFGAHIKQDELFLETRGEAVVKYGFEVKQFGIVCNGSEDLTFNGIANNANLKLKGAGNIIASDLVVKDCTIELSGSGDVNVQVTDVLDVNISGSGNVYYSGDPGIINKDITGTGQLIKVD